MSGIQNTRLPVRGAKLAISLGECKLLHDPRSKGCPILQALVNTFAFRQPIFYNVRENRDTVVEVDSRFLRQVLGGENNPLAQKMTQ